MANNLDTCWSGEHVLANIVWDDLQRRAGSDWIEKATDRALWSSLEEAYIQQWTATG